MLPSPSYVDHEMNKFSSHISSALALKMNGAKRSAEAVGCKNTLVGERSALEGSPRMSSDGQNGSENVGLSNANIGENPIPQIPKRYSARFIHRG
ncbi:hypothetical protein BUALT_BualtUnG0012300 [Buddleja alternifolia]|uniref:Uncharacterized protein n=1 Tax=Buddleja alternifolia TaxID=168488 RepID=A0AAV6W3W8_9LAMI|nr:hypothetical protein BUALT_BualtUnG0012300 [Buddleja alternifolia]